MKQLRHVYSRHCFLLFWLVVEQMQPDVVLMDIRMPGIDGLVALGRIRTAWPHIAVLLLTTYDEDELMI